MNYLFGRVTEETPKFDLLKKAEAGYEIRRYHTQLRASVTVDESKEGPVTNSGFGELAGYIFGGNTKRDGGQKETIAMTAPVMTSTTTTPATGNGGGSENIAMTAPVMTETDASKRTTTMSFILPSKYQKVEDLPIPKDSKVRIEEVDGYTVAVLRFSGRWTSQVTSVKVKQLLDMLREDRDVKLIAGDESKVEPLVARYNPPFTLPFLRTNEVMIPVTFTHSEA